MPYTKERIPEPNKKDIYRWDSKKAKPIVTTLWKQLVEPSSPAKAIDPKNYVALDVYLSNPEFYTHFKYNTFRPHLKELAEKALELRSEQGTGLTAEEAKEAREQAENEDDSDFDPKDEEEDDEEDEEDDQEDQDNIPLSDMSGKKATAVPKKRAAKKKAPVVEEEDDGDVDEVVGKMEKMTVIAKKNNPIKVYQIVHIGFSPDGEKRRILRVVIQGLSPGPRGVLARLRETKVTEKHLSFKVIADETELDAKEIFKEIYKRNPNHGAVTSLQDLLDQNQEPCEFGMTFMEAIKPKIGVDAHGRLIKSIKPYVTGAKGCPTLTFHFLLREQREKEIELDVAGVDATHSIDDDEEMDSSTPTPTKRSRAAAAAARRAGPFGLFGVFGN